jgi:hypothetical protein
MRPGRLPEDHPDEQEARAKLRALSPEAQAKLREQQTAETPLATMRQPQKPKPRKRWT